MTAKPNTNRREGFQFLFKTRKPKITCLLTIPDIINPAANVAPTNIPVKQSEIYFLKRMI